MNERFEQQMKFIIEIDKMKHILRRTLLTDGSRRENDAEHSWHIAVMAMLLSEHCPETVDVPRCVKMCVVHDLIEVYAGDTFAYDKAGNANKELREKLSADKLFSVLPKDQGDEIRALWEEFDAMNTPDSRYAAAMDRLQPFIHNHLTDGHTWKEGNVSLNMVYERMTPVKTALPEIWEYVEKIIADGVEKGYIKQQ